MLVDLACWVPHGATVHRLRVIAHARGAGAGGRTAQATYHTATATPRADRSVCVCSLATRLVQCATWVVSSACRGSCILTVKPVWPRYPLEHENFLRRAHSHSCTSVGRARQARIEGTAHSLISLHTNINLSALSALGPKGPFSYVPQHIPSIHTTTISFTLHLGLHSVVRGVLVLFYDCWCCCYVLTAPSISV